MKFILPFFFFFCIQSAGFTQKIILLKNKQELLRIGKKISVLADKAGKLTLQDVLTPRNQQRFKPNNKDIFSRKATNTTFWLKFTVQNQSGKDTWLNIGDTRLWYADFYAPNAKGAYLPPLLLGNMRPPDNRVFPHSFYCVPLGDKYTSQPQTYYLRVASKLNISLPLSAGTTNALVQQLSVYNYILAAFIGLIVSMAVYNLFLFFATKDSIYLIYVGYLLMVFISTPFNNGQTLFYGDWLWKYFISWQCLLFFFTTLFVDRYLNLALNARKMQRWLWLITSIQAGLFPLLNLTGVSLIKLLPLFQLLVLVYTFSLLICGIYLWAKGQKNARFYVLGWSSVIIASFIYMLTMWGMLPFTLFNKQILYFGFGFEALMFSLALGDRLNMLKQEKEDAQAKNLVLVTNQKETLEQKVIERTYEIQEQKEEIEAQNMVLQDTHTALTQAYSEIHKKNESLMASINYAQTIQGAMLSLQKQVTDLLGEHKFFILFKPRDIVSGDFYYVEEVEGKIVIAAIDCTGHGVPGALMSMIGFEIMNDIVKVRKETRANKILDRLHLHIVRGLKQNKTNNRDGMDVTLAVIDKTNNTLEYAGAKNPFLYIQAEEIHLIKGDKWSIGGYQLRQRKRFTSHTIDISVPTTFYLFSDGYQDQFGGKKNKKFMLKHLKKLCFDIRSEEMVEQKEILEQTLDFWIQQGNEQQIDDVLIMGVKI